jgi:ABC-type glycerol-3-phosphate transport system substrate-binding protein
MIRGVYFDANAFDAAGLPHPAPGWTWDDFRRDVEILAKSGGEAIRYGYAERFGTILSPLIEAALAENGGVVAPEKMQPVVQWYLDMVKAKVIRPTPDYGNMQGPDDWDALFKSANRPAMWGGMLGDTLPGVDFSTEMAYQEYGFAPYPVAADDPNQPSTPVWVQCLAVSSGSKNPHPSWQWLDFLSRHWLVVDKTSPQANLTIPGRVSVAQSEGYWQILPGNVQPAVKDILEQSGYAGS